MSERTTGTDETLSRITELARQALQAQATLAKQSLELGRATLSGDVDRSSAGRAYLDAVSREGARYWREVGALGLDYASELLALGTRSAARVVSEASAAGSRGRDHRATRGSSAGGPPPAEGAPDGTRRSAVVLRGVLGQTAQATVTVVNRHTRARRVELTPSDLRDTGGALVAARLRVDPEHVTVPPGGDHPVRLEVDLDAADAAVGDRYEGTVEVSGGDEATLEVTVEVVA
ncbi:hypothetical protein RKE38_09910 [Phycicoccus sp. M110.8]|uniref:hypothetical protein n=1 Tax=Phycicoccus sp. M110.8 TaxID=3075433 RepID=UPI0028FD19B3|nr:hypothetical protein [Phycicoccus sp. M110.8]MDU0313999.1 hypothetical protein [Phycicoccus sp. M110.8]